MGTVKQCLAMKAMLQNPATVETQTSSLKHLWANAKAAYKNERWQEAESAYRQILLENPDNEYANAGLGWVYFKWNKALLAKGRAAMEVVRRNIWKWLALRNDKTDVLYGLMLVQAKTLADNSILTMHIFLQWWDLANLQPDHWKKWTNDQKVTFDSIAVQVIRIAAKEVTKDPGVCSSDLSVTASWVDMALANDPENLWLIYYKGKLLLKLDRAKEAVNYFKSVVQQKLREGWAWHYLAEAMEESSDELTLACACKAVAESPADKSLRMRFHLARLLVKAQYFEEAKALIECMHTIAADYAVQMPKEVEEIKRHAWYANTDPSDDIENWIKKRGTEALGIFTAHLPWEQGCVGKTFVNAKQKTRVTIVLKEGDTIAVSANAFGLRKMKEGDPIELKKEADSSGKVSVLELRKRSGSRWDFAATAEAVVAGFNKKKNGVHFVGFTEAASEMPSMFYCPLSTAKNKLGLGDVVRLRFVPGEKNFVFSVTNLNKEASDKLLKKIHSTVNFIAPNRSFGMLDNEVFLSNTILANHQDITEESTISGQAVLNFNRKKNVWGWALLKIDAVENHR